MKVVLREKYIALNTYTRSEEKCKINNLSFHLRKLEREEKIKSKVSQRNFKNKNFRRNQ